MQGRRLTGTEHMLAAAEACGFATTQLDMAALPFAEQLQVSRSCHAPSSAAMSFIEHLALRLHIQSWCCDLPWLLPE